MRLTLTSQMRAVAPSYILLFILSHLSTCTTVSSAEVVPVFIKMGGTITVDQSRAGTAVIGLSIDPTEPSNVTWNTYAPLDSFDVTFGMELQGYDDPLGLSTLLSTGVRVSAVSIASPSFRDANITLIIPQCYLPKRNNVLYVMLGANATNHYGAVIAQERAPVGLETASLSTLVGSVAISMPEDDEGDIASDGLAVVGLICGLCGITLLLGNWFDALYTMMQLQWLVLWCYTSCAPQNALVIFGKSVWVLWPLSTRNSNVTNPEDQGRMLFNFILTGIMLVVQSLAVLAFAYFSSRSMRSARSAQDPRSRVKFPQGTLLVAGFLFQGSMMSCVKTFALHYLGFLGDDVAGPLTLAVFTCIFLLAQLICIWVVVFKIVSQQVFLEPLTKSFFVFAFVGGNWANADVRKQWGVLFDGVNGSSFWFLGASFTLAAANAMLAGFVPGSLDACTTVYYIMLVIQVLVMLLMYVRRPFKCVAHNVLNMIVTLLQTVVAISFVSAMECSRMNSRFSSFAVWFTLCALCVKSFVSAVLQVIARGRAAMQAPLRIPLATQQLSPSPERHNDLQARRRDIHDAPQGDEAMARQLLQDIELEEEQRSVVYQLESTVEHNAQRMAAMWKPLLPQPSLLGSSVISREVGFGGPGGLVANEGPSVALKLFHPGGMCCNGDTLYVLDSGHHRILAHQFAQRRSQTVCGGQSGSGYAGDLSSDPFEVSMDEPRFIATGHRVVYFSDTGNDCVRRVDLASGQTVTMIGGTAAASTARLTRPMGLQTFGQYLYVADSGTHRILQYDFQENILTPVCGTGFPGYDGDGAFSVASRLNNPQGLCIRPRDGMLFIADTGNHRVVRMDPTTRRLTVVLGCSGRGGESLASGFEATNEALQGNKVLLCMPTDVACGPDDSILVVDAGNSKVWIVNQYGYARVLLPSSNLVVPRNICVPRWSTASSSSGTTAVDAVSQHKTKESPPQSNRNFRGGTSLSTG